MSETEEHKPPVRRRRVITAVTGGILAVGLAAGVTVSALSSAGAQTPTPNQGPEAPGSKAPNGKPWPGGDLKRGPGHLREGRFGFGPGIHGEFTTPKEGGGYQTLGTQIGEVTSVSSSSISLKSEDGFTRTYSVDDKTRVIAGRNGISDVKKGDTVRILAVVEAGRARSLSLFDVSSVKDLRLKFREGLPKPREGAKLRPGA